MLVILRSFKVKLYRHFLRNVNDFILVGETTVKSQIVKPCEVEYAVVDKSKKNRFTSLPALNSNNSASSPAENEDKDPPIPPKKMLHKRFVYFKKIIIINVIF